MRGKARVKFPGVKCPGVKRPASKKETIKRFNFFKTANLFKVKQINSKIVFFFFSQMGLLLIMLFLMVTIKSEKIPLCPFFICLLLFIL
jgi:hypothetical protein